ncbi:hypothetical protein GP486_002099 [Trichoglossum hirsutum]|uniref:Uncharacterized protein n=1 Tax=Trichoglossum hirsutum TaxID=265104 RepID=A0A9P8LFF3_9PEZI|nr:hypothetical protein GP486_002099 [Trichoglossum hirsutum]
MDGELLLRASRALHRCVSQVLLLLLLLPLLPLLVAPGSVQGAPATIHRRHVQQISLIEPGTDAWAEALSGVGPLILLVGERSIKQLLRNARGFHNAFSLAAAPLGLLSMVTSVIRLCGPQRLRAFIGYELEARVAAAVEMTRVNCGGVHAEMVDGYLVRSTAADPSGQAIAVSKLEGDFDALAAEAEMQIRACASFERKKSLARIPSDIAPFRWCLQMTASAPDRKVAGSMIETLVRAVGIQHVDDATRRFQTTLAGSYGEQGDGGSRGSALAGAAPNGREEGLTSEESSNSHRTPPSPQLTFLCSLEAVSEFATSSPVAGVLATFLGIASFSSVLCLQIIALWQKKWHFSAGWILMFVGYAGIVVSVSAGVVLIRSSCICVELKNRSANNAEWVDGVVISVKNTDSMDTAGSSFMTSPKRAQIFEAVWKKDLTARQSFLATTIVMLLVASFVSHYLGLRSSRWWISVGELFICLISAFARSITKDRQERFTVVPGLKIDKRCTSTGVIRMQKSEKMNPSPRTTRGLDFRSYARLSNDLSPVSAEQIAWHAATLCVEDGRVLSKVMELTGMLVTVSKQGQEAGDRAVLVSFFGGILVDEGLLFPGARMAVAFSSPIGELAAPTPLLARAIMRQPQWMVENPEMGGGAVPLGNVYIFSVNSMMDWWTVSEDRNDLGDLQRNLQWPFVLVNLAFFIALLTLPETDPELVAAVAAAQKVTGNEKEVAEDVVAFLKLLCGPSD